MARDGWTTTRRALGVLGTLAIVLPPAILASLVARHARNLPWWDQWGLVPFMVLATEGRFPPHLLWAQVNEHRIPTAMLLQGAVAWWTRWDVRFDAWTNVAIAVGSLLALGALARRTLRTTAPDAIPWVTLTCALLVCSPVAGPSWTAGWITPAFLAALAAAVLAWLVAGWTGTWPRFAAMVLCASAGALAFGSGMMLVVLLPAVVLAKPGVRFGRRVQQAIIAAGWGAALLYVYFLGWAPRHWLPPPVFHADRWIDYPRYAFAYVGSAVGIMEHHHAHDWGIAMAGALVGASSWLVWRRPDLRAVLVPWWTLALFGLGNGFVTAYGRLDDGPGTATLPRYVPTAALFAASVVAVVTLAIADVLERSRPAGAALFAAGLLSIAVASGHYRDGARQGVNDMIRTARRLDEGAACLTSCADATDACLRTISMSVPVGRRMCPLMEHARIGPFRR